VSDAVRKYNSTRTERSYIRVAGYGVAGSGRQYVSHDGGWYVIEENPYTCAQVRLGLGILSDNPYLLFDVVMKKSQVPSVSDGDEADTDDSDGEDDASLEGRFVVEFNDNMSSHTRDSLARVLHGLIQQQPDSLRWILDY
jgi:hypothetical protein